MKRLLLTCLILSLTGCVRGVPLPRFAPVKVPPLPRVVRPPLPAPLPVRPTPVLPAPRPPLPAVSRLHPETRAVTGGAKAAEDHGPGDLLHIGGHVPHLLRDDDKKDKPEEEVGAAEDLINQTRSGSRRPGP